MNEIISNHDNSICITKEGEGEAAKEEDVPADNEEDSAPYGKFGEEINVNVPVDEDEGEEGMLCYPYSFQI